MEIRLETDLEREAGFWVAQAELASVWLLSMLVT